MKVIDTFVNEMSNINDRVECGNDLSLNTTFVDNTELTEYVEDEVVQKAEECEKDHDTASQISSTACQVSQSKWSGAIKWPNTIYPYERLRNANINEMMEEYRRLFQEDLDELQDLRNLPEPIVTRKKKQKPIPSTSSEQPLRRSSRLMTQINDTESVSEGSSSLHNIPDEIIQIINSVISSVVTDVLTSQESKSGVQDDVERLVTDEDPINLTGMDSSCSNIPECDSLSRDGVETQDVEILSRSVSMPEGEHQDADAYDHSDAAGVDDSAVNFNVGDPSVEADEKFQCLPCGRSFR